MQMCLNVFHARTPRIEMYSNTMLQLRLSMCLITVFFSFSHYQTIVLCNVNYIINYEIINLQNNHAVCVLVNNRDNVA